MYLYEIINLIDGKRYAGIKDVAIDGFNPKNICNACRGRTLTHKNFVWMYEEDYLKNPNKLIQRASDGKNTKARPCRYKKVFGMNIKTKQIVQYDAVYHVKKDGFTHSAVHKCCHNPKTYRSHKGFVWSFNQKDLVSKLTVALNKKTHKVK